MRGRGLKLHNKYALELDDLYAAIPKAVVAAVAVSAVTCGGDQMEHARTRVLAEWWTLFDNGIVPQKPPFPRPASTDGPMD